MTALTSTLSAAQAFLILGGPAIWAIAVLSVAGLAVILWKLTQLLRFGAWSGGAHTAAAVALWAEGREEEAMTGLAQRRSLRATLALAAMRARRDPTLDEQGAEAETERVARGLLADARRGLRALDLIQTIAPLLGLLGTVMGMIGAFQTLQEAGAQADPATLAGGIWEALLTTAAGMTVAIPAGIALVWFEAAIDRVAHDMEDTATRIFLRKGRPERADAAERASRAAE